MISKAEILINKDGPYTVKGEVLIKRFTIKSNDEGDAIEWIEGNTLHSKKISCLCRCGESGDMPYCDGTHDVCCFDGTETASKAPYFESAIEYESESLVLYDNEELCSVTRFCDAKGTIWNLINQTENSEVNEEIKYQASCCPSGRLVIKDKKTGEIIESKLEESIGLIDDPFKKVSGPIWVRGGISIKSETNGEYEIRNRVTLCRCGKSNIKPFCDGTHIDTNFKE